MILKIIGFPFVMLAFICASPILAWLSLFYFTKDDAEKLIKDESRS